MSEITGISRGEVDLDGSIGIGFDAKRVLKARQND
jgi:hypothetical protein